MKYCTFGSPTSVDAVAIWRTFECCTAHASFNEDLDGADVLFPFFAPVITALKVGWEQS